MHPRTLLFLQGGGDCRAFGDSCEGAGMGPERFELGGVGFAFEPRLGRVFLELPVEEAGAEAGATGWGA